MSDEVASHSPIRVLIVDDSAFMRAALSRIVLSDYGLEVAGTAGSGAEALRKIGSLDPDVVTLDIEMPDLDGVETLREIMKRHPRPVIMVSAISEKDAEITFDALSAGAFDYVPKRMSGTSLEIADIRSDLVGKIRCAASHRQAFPASVHSKRPVASAPLPGIARLPVTPEIIAIGTSTGGPRALQELLPRLPANFPVPLLIVQHMPPGFTTALANRLDRLCSIKVREPDHGERVQSGVAYIAPAGTQMIVKRRFDSQSFISLENQPAATYIPSVDVLMKSVAETYGNRSAGVIMTGMGSDGADGMKAIHDCGGLTIGQDETSCVVYGMPRVCAQRGILTTIVPLSRIASKLLDATEYRRGA